MVRLLAGSLNEPRFSHRPVSGSSRRICARSEFLTQTLPSTSGAYEGLLRRIGLPLVGDLPDLKGLRLLVEFRHASLIHHGNPEIAGLVRFEIEGSERITGLDHGQLELRDLAGLRIQPAQELLAKMGEPHHSLGVDN